MSWFFKNVLIFENQDIFFKPDEDLQYIGRKFVIKNICSEEF